MSCRGRSKMTTSRKTNDTHLVRLNIPLRSMTPDNPHGPLCINKRQMVISGWQPVFQNDTNNTMTVQPPGYAVPLSLHHKSSIPTTRTNNNRCFCCLRGCRQMYKYRHICFFKLTITYGRLLRPDGYFQWLRSN